MSEASPRFFSTEFKIDLVARLERGEAAARVARATGVARKLVYDWLKAYRKHGAAGLNRKRGRKVGWRPPRAARTNWRAPRRASPSSSG